MGKIEEYSHFFLNKVRTSNSLENCCRTLRIRKTLAILRKNGASVMFWGCVCFNGVGTLTSVDGNINTDKYIKNLHQKTRTIKRE